MPTNVWHFWLTSGANLGLESQLFAGVVLGNGINAGVAANHLTVLVLGLVHHLRIIGPVELGDRDKGSPQRVSRVPGAEVGLYDVVDGIHTQQSESRGSC